jgi:hypothetical protein
MLRRHKHKLIDFGTTLFFREEEVIPLLNRANIRYKEITLAGSSSDMWRSIVGYANTRSKIEDLINAMIETRQSLGLEELKTEMAQQSPAVLAEYLKTIIDNRECVLFIGPLVFKYMDTENDKLLHFNSFFARKLSEWLTDNDIFFDTDSQDNLSYMIDRYESRALYVPGDTENFAKKVYKELLDLKVLNSNIHRAAELLNFPLIINTNPDTLLDTPQNEGNYIHSWYDISNSFNEVPKIPHDHVDKTIVYNIYGSFVNAFSILFTERETVGFTKSAYKELPPMPPEVINIIKRSHGLFIGFDFKDWHHKILFDVLDLKNKPGNYAICPQQAEILEYEVEYYHRQYNMTFVHDDPLQFLLKLR